MYVPYTMQMPFKEELEWLLQHDKITPLGVDKTAFMPQFHVGNKTKWKIRLYLDPAR